MRQLIVTSQLVCSCNNSLCILLSCEDHDSIRWSVVTPRSVHSHGNSSYTLSAHDCVWKIMPWWDNWWWRHSQSIPVATHRVFCRHMTVIERRSWTDETIDGGVTVGPYPQQLIVYFVIARPRLKEDQDTLRRMMVMSQSVCFHSKSSCILSSHNHTWKKIVAASASKSQTNNPLNHIPFLDAATQPLPPPPPSHSSPPCTHPPTPPSHTAALTFSMAAPTSCGNGPLLPMQVMQP